MTSSFTMPGGIETSFYRAVPSMSGVPLNGPGAKKVRTQWELVERATPEGAPSAPPDRAADYVGQIVAVAAPRTTSPA